MHAVEQYDEQCAVLMRDACGMSEDSTFLDRARLARVWSLYDPMPCGAVVVEGPFIHVGSTRPCGLAVRRIVNDVLKSAPFLVAAIKGERRKAVELARLLGFDMEATSGDWTLLRRNAWVS